MMLKKERIKSTKAKKKLFLLEDFILTNIVYDCKLNLIKTHGILEWKPKNIYDPSNKNVLNSDQNIKLISTNIKNDGKGLHNFFSGNYFQQDIIAIPNNVINIYCVYK